MRMILVVLSFAVVVVVLWQKFDRFESNKLEAAQTEKAEEEKQKRVAAAQKASTLRPGAVFRDALSIGGKGPVMVVIPAGLFLMGDIQGGGWADEKRLRRGQIQKPFAMGKYEVTFDEYQEFVRATGVHRPYDGGWGKGTRPIINVSWDDAVAYVRWMSEQTGGNYRLPSEAEWEYAARANTNTRYPWGNDSGRNKANCKGCGSQWDHKQTAPVGSFEANGFALYDMTGNVMEWTEDCWHETYKNAPANGSAWGKENDGVCGRRVSRGGSWFFGPKVIRPAFRNGYDSDSRADGLGFRLARTLK